MRYTKKISSGRFFKKGEDIKDGDTATIANEGKQEEGQFGTQNLFLIKLPNEEEGQVSFNQTSLNNLIDAYGDDSKNWIGKEVKVFMIKMSVSGKIRSVYFFLHPASVLDDETGEFSIGDKKDDGIPVINTDIDEANQTLQINADA